MKSLLEQVGCSTIQDNEKGFQVSCPFAEFRDGHRHAIDHNPSMGIAVREDETCLVHCFACGFSSASLIVFVKYYLWAYPEEDKSLLDLAIKIETFSLETIVDIPEYDVVREKKVVEKTRIFANWQISRMVNRYHPYLRTRGIRKATAHKWELGFDEINNRVVFPIRDFEGNLVGLTGRPVTQYFTGPRYYHYWNFDKGRTLYGLHLKGNNTTGVLVEGQIDTLWAYQALIGEGYFPLGTSGAMVTKTQIDLAVKHCDRLILAFDDDSAGWSGYEKSLMMIAGRIPTYCANWKITEANDPGDAREEFARVCREATPAGMEQLFALDPF